MAPLPVQLLDRAQLRFNTPYYVGLRTQRIDDRDKAGKLVRSQTQLNKLN